MSDKFHKKQSLNSVSPLGFMPQSSQDKLGLVTLEPRLLLDAAGFVTGAEVAMDAMVQMDAQTGVEAIFNDTLMPRHEASEQLIQALEIEAGKDAPHYVIPVHELKETKTSNYVISTFDLKDPKSSHYAIPLSDLKDPATRELITPDRDVRNYVTYGADGYEFIDPDKAGDYLIPALDIKDFADQISAAIETSSAETTLVFVDTSVQGYQTLVDGLPDGVEIILIDADEDGIKRMAEILASRDDVDAVHILSHGESGAFNLGSAVVDEQSITGEYADEFAIINAALSDSADILIYGCDFGADINAVNALALATGADIAASNDDTGAAALGGDWNLEVKAGDINTEAFALTSFAGVLAPELIVNGDFSVATNSGTDWTLGAGASQSFSGTEYIQFVGNTASGVKNIFQDITTVIGQQYSLTYDHGTDGALPSPTTLRAAVLDGATVIVDRTDTLINGSAATTNTLTFTATSTTTRIFFEEPSTVGTTTFSDPTVDNVSVMALADTDGDGIADINDIDDDNDGILDRDEYEFYDAFSDPDFEDTRTGPGEGFENFTTAYPGSSWNTSATSSGNIANFVDSIPDGGTFSGYIPPAAASGDAYVALHSGGAFQNEVLQNTLNNNLFAGETYLFDVTSLIIDLTTAFANPLGNNPGSIVLFGVQEGTNPTLDATTLADTATIDNLVGVDRLATTDQVTSNSTWNRFTVEFAAGATYDRILVAIEGVDSFLAIDNIQIRTPIDRDGDGIFDSRDLDSDNDGISDIVESGNAAAIAADTNNDGTISDAEAAAAFATEDNDGDGLQDLFDADINSANPNVSLGTQIVDTDDDGVADLYDLDSDGDGIADAIEARTTNAQIPLATLADGAAADAADSDDDGILDVFETASGTFGGDFTAPNDDDADGIADFISTDSDGDGASDAAESGLNGTLPADVTYLDADGTLDVTTLPDVDSDMSDVDFRSVQDTDGDGIGDFEDIDDDNDGILDTVEGLVEAVLSGLNLNDGAAIFSGAVNNGAAVDYTFATELGDITISYARTDGQAPFINGTGNAAFFRAGLFTITFENPVENFSLDFSHLNTGTGEYVHNFSEAPDVVDTDVDGNGTDLVWDASFDEGNAAFSDNGVLSGTSNVNDRARLTWTGPLSSLSFSFNQNAGAPYTQTSATIQFEVVGGATATLMRDTDGDSISDHLDLDSDNDGISDLIEGGNANLIAADTNNDGTVSLVESSIAVGLLGDQDMDGLSDVVDNTTVVGAISTGVTPTNTDGDALADYLDLDSDADGIADAIEARATNAQIPLATLADGAAADAADSDDDGILDVFETASGTFGGDFAAPNDDDADGTADYISTDSDGDGLLDSVESGLAGLPVDVTYLDADGTLDVTRLPNVDRDTTDVDFRSFRDTDGDGISDSQDVDDDNDGILDTVEDGVGDILNLSGLIQSGTFNRPITLDNGLVVTVTANPAAAGDQYRGDANGNLRMFGRSGNPTTLTLTFSEPTVVEFSRRTATTVGGSAGNFDGNERWRVSASDALFSLTDRNSALVDARAVGQNAAAATNNIISDGSVYVDSVEFTPRGNNQQFSLVSTPVTSITIDYTSIANGTNAGIINIGIQNVLSDTDGDGIINSLDLDSDNDGISDLEESGSGGLDANNDGVLDEMATPALAAVNDADGDGLLESLDNGNEVAPINTDGDALANFLDLDSDGDGIADAIEARATNAQIPLATLADGAAADAADSDDDGILDVFDSGTTFGGDFTAPNDDDADGTADYISTDSDGDGIGDALEGGLDASLPIDVSYLDADGTVDIDPATAAGLTNLDSDATDLDFRSLQDTDGDGIGDFEDLDDDNDGIRDDVEIQGNADTGLIARWSANAATGAPGNTVPDNIDPTFAENVSNLIPGSGITFTPDAANEAITVSGLDSANLAEARANGDYVEITFDTQDDFGQITSIAFGVLNAPAAFGYQYAFEISDDGFATSETLVEANQALPQDAGGTGYIFSQTDVERALILRPNTSYTVRLYLYGNPAGNGTDATLNDFHIFHQNLGNADVDGDGIINSLDLDSDNDGISDINESGSGATDANNDGVLDEMATADLRMVNDLDNDGLLDSLDNGNEVTPRNTDGDALADYHDLDSDADGLADAIEARPTAAGNVIDGANNTDSDGDGIIDAFDTGTTFGGDFSAPNDDDTDGTPDYISTDSDGDGILDADENDQNGVLAADVTYDDADGSLDPATLRNQDGDPLDVDFRSTSDRDNDGVPDTADIDSDNDGILDVVELGILPAAGVAGEADAFPAIANGWFQVINGATIDGVTYGNGQLFSFNPLDNSYIPVGTPPAGLGVVNSAGFDPDTGFIYAVVSTPMGVDSAGVAFDGTKTLIKYDRDGEVFIVASGVNNGNAGDVYNGELWIIRGGGTVMQSFDLTDGTRTRNITLSGAAFGQLEAVNVNGTFYGVTDSGSGYEVTYVDVTAANDGDTLTVNTVSITGLEAATGGFGAAFQSVNPTTGDIELYFSNNNTGIIYRIDGYDTATPTAVAVATGTSTSSNDGAASPLAPSILTPRDTDGDGIADHLDLDSDNDGISDLVESGNAAGIAADTNNDGTIDDVEAAAAFATEDNDNDGLQDVFDADTADTNALNSQGTTPVNTDGDTVDDYRDLDSDNDGISDLTESGSGEADANNDGVLDNMANPTIAAIFDADRDGLVDVLDNGNRLTPRQTDGDGLADYRDLDSDGDGVADAIEARPTADGNVITSNVDSDGDGVIDHFDTTNDGTFGGDFTVPNDDDTDGTADYISVDADGDGIIDSVESGLNGVLPGDVTYTDADGTLDPNSLPNLDNDASDVDFRSFQDTDGDGLGDFEDIDDDNDGILDVLENNDLSTAPVSFVGLTNAGGTFDTNTNGVDVVGVTVTPGVVTAGAGDNANGGISTSFGGDAGSGIRFEDGSPGRTGTTIASTLSFDSATNFRIAADTDNDADPLDGPAGNVNNSGVDLIRFTVINPSDDFDWNFTLANLSNSNGDASFTITGNTLEIDLGTPAGAGFVGYDFTVIGEANGVEVEFETTGNVPTATANSHQFGIFTREIRDTDGDGVRDALDLDSDNDGISDLEESGSGGTDANNDGVLDNMATPALAALFDADGDGLLDTLDNGNEVTPRQTDGDGIADFLDLDSDGDRIADAIEARPTADGNVITSNVDSDGDGVIDHFDTNSTFGGNFTAPVDTDSGANLNNNPDGIADYIDTDSDGDGILDANENGLNLFVDTNGDGIGDDTNFNISYADADGSLVPSTTLVNFAGDTSEVAYRELNQPVIIDLDDDTTTADRDNEVSVAVSDTILINPIAADGGAFDPDSTSVSQIIIEIEEATFLDASDEFFVIAGEDVSLDSNSVPTFAITNTAISVNGNDYTLRVTRVNSAVATATVRIQIIQLASQGDGQVLLTDANDILQGLQYRNDAGENATFGDRVYTVRAIGDQPIASTESNTATGTISLTDSPPIIDLNDDNTTADLDSSATYAEGDGAVSIIPGTADAIDSANNITTLRITAAGLVDGGDESFTVNGVTFTQGIDLTDTTASIGGVPVTMAYVGGTLTITATDGVSTLDQAALDTVVRGITYEHVSENPTEGDRTFSFTATDASGNDTALAAVATVTVVEVNDAPEGTDNTVTATEDTDYTFTAADFGFADPLDSNAFDRITINPLTGNGTLTFNGTEITSTSVILASDIANLIYTPVTDENGTSVASFTFQVTDDGGTANGGEDTDQTPNTITIDITPINDDPVAVDDSFSANEDDGAAVVGNVLATNPTTPDSDLDGDTLTVSMVDGAAGNVGMAVAGSMGGLFTIDSAGVITFDTNGDFEALDDGEMLTTVITYEISDGNGGTDTAAVSVLVTGSNDAPNLVAGIVIPTQMGTDSAMLASLDTSTLFEDVDVETLTYSSPNLPSWMSLDMATGVITGTPPADGSQGGPANDGEYSITIVASDGDLTVSTTVIYQITNPLPVIDVATPDTVAVDGEVISIQTDFSDPDGDILSYTATGLPNGLCIDPATGEITGTLDPDASQVNGGVYTITVTADDNEGGAAIDTFNLTVTNPAPTANDDTGTASEDGMATGNVITASDTDPDMDDLFVSEVDGAAGNVGMAVAGANGGLFTINMDGSFTFDANGDFEALDVGETDTTTLTYQVSDGEGGTDTATVTITIQGANDAPIVTGTLAGQTGQDGVAQVPFDASTVFSDVDVETLLYGSPDLPSWMSIDSATGEITGTPPADASQSGPLSDGVYTVTVTATDPDGEEVSTTVTYTFTNPPPIVDVAVGAQSNVDGDMVSIPVDFSDPDGDTLSYTATGLPNGLSIDPATGEITGTLDANASQVNGGVYTITVTADDGEGGTVTDTFDLTVTNPAPIALDDAATANENQVITGNVITASDSDPDGDVLTVSMVNGDAANVGTAIAGSTGGQFTINTDGSFSFDPGTDFENLDLGETATSTVTYEISDGEGGTDTAVITVTIEGGNDAPIVTGTLTPQTGQEGVAQVPFDASTVFSDIDNEPLTYSSDNLPSWMTIDPASGEITGTPPADASQGGPANDGVYVVNVTATDPDGEDVTTQVTYSFTNPPPVVDVETPDVMATDNEVLSIPADFSDPDGDTLSYTAAGLPNGLMIDPVTGEITGTLDADASQVNGGVYTITVTADDGEGGTVTDTFDITVTNEAPVVDTPVGPQTADDNAVVSIPTALSDPDGDDLSYTAAGLPTGLSIDPVTGEITGTVDPSASQGGPLGDGVYTVTVTGDDGQGGTVTDTFTFTATNPAPVVDLPIGNQTANDADIVSITPSISDPDGDALTYSVTGLPAGLNIIPSTGEIVGMIDSSASQGGPLGDGVYTVIVTADDGEGGMVTDTFTYTISNPAPDAVDDMANANEGAPITGFVILGSDSDPDQDVLSVSQVNGDAANVGTAVTGSNGGEFIINSDGTFSFDPNGDFDMLDVGETDTTTITYEVSDGEGGTDTATVTITVNGANDAPITTGTLTAQTGTDSVAQVPFDASTVFSDVDAEPLTYSSANLPSWMSIDAMTGEITGTPPSDASQGGANSDGVYVITVTATDPDGESVDANVVYTFENVAPVAQNDVFTTAEDTPLFVNVIPASDSDADGDTLVIDMAALSDGTLLPIGTSTTLPEGVLTINADGSVEFDPADNFNGPFTFGYTLSDGEGGTDVATVTINVTDVNDAPELDLNGVDTGADEAIIVANDDPSTPIIPDALITDVDSTTLTSVTGIVGGNADGAGEAFTLGGEDLGIGTGGATFDVTIGGTTFSVLSDGTSFTATVTAGTGDVADVNALMASLEYEHTQNPPTLGNRTVTLSTADDLGLASNDAVVTIRVVEDTTAPEPPVVNPPEQEPEGPVTVTGTGEPGSTVKVEFADGTIGTAEIAADGSWSVTSEGVQTTGDVVVTVCDNTGNESPPVTTPWVDNTPPLPPELDEPEQNPNGTLTATGTGEPGATITLTFPNGEMVTTIVDPEGNFTGVSTTPQTSGDVVATQTDEAGNESGEDTEDFVDNNPPLPPVIEPPVQDPEGLLIVNGTGEPGATIKVTFANGETGEVIVAEDGSWLLNSTTVQTSGDVVVSQCDEVGNESPSVTIPWVDDNSPLAPELFEPEQNPDGTLTVTGTGEPGAEVTVTFLDGETVTTTVNPDGTFTLISLTPQTSVDVVATQTDEAENMSGEVIEDFVDNDPPLPPELNEPEPNPDGTLIATGSGEPGAEVTVTFPNGEMVTVTVDPEGNFTAVSTTSQTSGDVTATQTDQAGNESGEDIEDFVDDSPPLPPTIEAEHNNETGLVDVTGTGEPGATITLTFPNGETVEVIVDENGNYSATSKTPQSDGDVFATQADAAGNSSGQADDDYSNLDIAFVDMGDNGQTPTSGRDSGGENGAGDSLSDKGEGGFTLQRYFREFFDRTSNSDFERSLDKERKTGVNVEVPRLGDGTDHVVVATVAFEHNINVQLTAELLNAANVKSWSVTSVDGTALPDWVEYVPGSDFFEMWRPLDQDTVKLRVRAVLDNGRTVSKVVEIDMRTGVVQDEGGTFNQAQTLDDQLALETQKLANSNADLIKALAS